MSRSRTAFVILAIAIVMAIPTVAGGADAVGEDDVTHYCYGDVARLDYQFSDGAVLSWNIDVHKEGGVVNSYTEGNERTIRVSLADADYAVVTQTATLDGASDTETITIRAMHVARDADSRYVVSFMDGSAELDRTVIDETVMVPKGSPFFNVPSTPVRDGYTFLGWYSQDAGGSEVRLADGGNLNPVTSDLVFYAKWASSTTSGGGGSGGSGGGSHTIVVNNIHTVTFVADPGLGYEVLTTTGSTVSFTAGILDGYALDGDISVTSSAGTIQETDDGYTLAGISQNIVVTISGDTHLIWEDEPEDPFPWWIVVLAIVIVAAVAIVLYWRHRSLERS